MKIEECNSPYGSDVLIGGDAITTDDNNMVERHMKTCFYISTVLKRLDMDRCRYFIDYVKSRLYNNYQAEVNHCWGIIDYINPKTLTHIIL